MEQNLAEYSAIAIIVIFLIKEMFSFLKVRKSCSNGGLTKQVQLIGENHLEHILKAIERQTNENSEWHRKQTEVLIEIKTILRERKP